MPLSCSDYFCPTDGSCIKRPIQVVSLSPFVRMSFPAIPSGSGSAGGSTFSSLNTEPAADLTMGNDSNIPDNHAFIKSFQYGQSSGNGATVEIFDQEGGEFDLFVSKIVKVLSDASNYGCQIEWGWSLADCDGFKSTIKSSKHYFNILSVNMVYQSTGILFKVELLDLMEPLFETRLTDNPENLTLKAAITELFTQSANPKIKSVKFKRMTPTAGGKIPCNNLISENGLGNQTLTVDANSLDDFKFKGALETSTAEKWPSQGLNPLAAVRTWLQDKMTDKNKGTIIFWNSASRDSELIILEDPKPKCWSEVKDKECFNSIGTYIIGGGKDSPVLSFEPTIKFNFGANAAAGAGQDDQTAEGKKEKGAPCPEGSGKVTPPGSGSTTFIQMSEAFNQIYGPGNLNLSIEGIAAQTRANKYYENIEAEMVIQGDPTLDNPFTIKARTVSILVINPFHLRNKTNGGSFDGCPEWLVGPPCNQILSNKNWRIDGVSHNIENGSYTTTLKINLPAPGQDNSF